MNTLHVLLSALLAAFAIGLAAALIRTLARVAQNAASDRTELQPAVVRVPPGRRRPRNR